MDQIKIPKVLCEAINYGSAFSRAVEIEVPKKLLFISGTASVGPHGETKHRGQFKAQTNLMFKNISAILSESNLTWKSVIKTTIYLRDIDRDYEEFNEIRRSFYAVNGVEPYPSSTCIEAKLCRSNLLIEMDAIAVK